MGRDNEFHSVFYNALVARICSAGFRGGGAPYGCFTGRLLPKAVFFVLFLFFAIPAGERIDLFLSYEKKDQFLFLVFEKGTVASRISILKVMV